MRIIEFVRRWLPSRWSHWRTLAILGCVCITSIAASCPFIPRPPQGAKILGVPYHAQSQSWGCSFACIQMVYHYRRGDPYPAGVTQGAIENWFRQTFPSLPPNTGPNVTQAAQGASHFLLENIVADLYSGVVGTQQAVADQENNLGVNMPTIVAVNPLNSSISFHAVVVEGTNWHELNDAIKRPDISFMYTKDPEGSPGGTTISVGDWLNYRIPLHFAGCPQLPCAVNIQPGGQKTRGQAGLEAFDDAGGTYYGAPPPNPTGRYKIDGNGNCYWEPSDSGPDQCTGGGNPTGRYKLDGNGNCYWDPNDSGPDQCQPELAQQNRWRGVKSALGHWARSARPALSLSPGPSVGREPSRWGRGASSKVQEAGGQRTILRSSELDKAVAEGRFIPNPFGTKPDEILANVGAAVRQSRLERFPELATLGLRAPRVIARRILSVRTLDPIYGPDYYVLDLVDLGGKPYAHLAISKAGILREIEDRRGDALRGAVDLEQARQFVSNQLKLAASEVEYVFAFSIAERSASICRPLAAVKSNAGTVYVNAKGEAFAEAGTDLARERSRESSETTTKRPNFMDLRKIDN